MKGAFHIMCGFQPIDYMSPKPSVWTETVRQQALQQLADGLRAMGCAPGAEAQQQMVDYLMLMSRWNRAYNLTAIRQPQAMVERHLLDSLSIAGFIRAATVIDAGTGAGLPGIPLAIADRSRRFVLLDSNGKKIRFVRTVVRQLDLTHVQPIQARLEDFSSAGADVDIVCRALAPLAQLIEWSADKLVQGARLLAMKAELSDSELSAVPDDYNVRIEPITQSRNFDPPGPERCLVVITQSQTGERKLT